MATNHEETRIQIVKAARDVFSRYGYKKTTLDDIASSLYRVKSSLYYYFNSKEDLFQAVITYEAERARKIIYAAVDLETTPEAKIRTYFQTILTFLNETVNYYKLMQEEIIDVMSSSNEIKVEHSQETKTFISTMLKAGIADGSFTVDDVDETTEAIDFAFHELYNPLVQTTAKTLDRLLDILFYGIKTNRPSVMAT